MKIKRIIAMFIVFSVLYLFTTKTSSAAQGDLYSTLVIGSTGSEVECLQELLLDNGFYNDYIDGSFGPYTQSCVLYFQEANHLTIDGIVGPETWNRLIANKNEIYELARIIFCEAAGTSEYTQWLVGSAAYNLVHKEGKSYRDPMVFEVNFYSNYFDNGGEPMNQQYRLAREIINGNRSNVRYFRTDYYHPFGTPYCESDNVYFSMP